MNYNKFYTLTFILTLMVFAITRCYSSWNCIEGNKVIKKELRNLDKINKINLANIGNVYIKTGENQSIEVETDANILQYIETELENDVLKIDNEESICPSKLNVYITVQSLEGLKVSGSGDIYFQNKLTSPVLSLIVNGSGNIYIKEVDAFDIKADISGSGDIKVESGSGKRMEGEINGSGNIDFENCIYEKSMVNISGSGDCIVNAENLDIEINGSGNVIYKGNPKNIKQNINGSGKIRKI